MQKIHTDLFVVEFKTRVKFIVYLHVWDPPPVEKKALGSGPGFP